MSDKLGRSGGGGGSELVAAVRVDLARLYGVWMSMLFPRQREAHSVLGRWQPDTTAGRVKYRLWGAVGAVLVPILYPFALLGFATRFYARRIDRVAARIGPAGVVLVSALVWGALTLLARARFSANGVIAVGAAGAAATISAVLARVFTRGGRRTSVLVGYPFAVTALFLPPVVAALYSPTLAEVVFPRSELLAIWILDNLLFVGGLNTAIRQAFDLQGGWYVAMWFLIAIPVGWFVGGLLALAELVRPSEESGRRRGM